MILSGSWLLFRRAAETTLAISIVLICQSSDLVDLWKASAGWMFRLFILGELLPWQSRGGGNTVTGCSFRAPVRAVLKFQSHRKAEEPLGPSSATAAPSVGCPLLLAEV